MKNNYRTPRITFLQAFLTLLCTLSITLSGFSQGVDCATAQNITPSVSGTCTGAQTITDTTDDSTYSPNPPDCAADFNREGWYVFTVSTGATDISIIEHQN